MYNKLFVKQILLIISIFSLTITSVYARTIRWSLKNELWNYVNYICYETPMTWWYHTCILKYLDHKNSFNSVNSWWSNWWSNWWNTNWVTNLPTSVTSSSTISYGTCITWWIRYYKSNNCNSNSVIFTCTNWQLYIWTQSSPAPSNPIDWEILYNTQSECLNNQWWSYWNFNISETIWVIDLTNKNTASTTISWIKQENTKVCAEVLINPARPITFNTWYCDDTNHYINRTITSEWQYNWTWWNVNYAPSFYINSPIRSTSWLKVAIYIMDKSTWYKVTWTINVIWELSPFWENNWSTNSYWTCTVWWMKYYKIWNNCRQANFYCINWQLTRWTQASPAPAQPSPWVTFYENSSCN